MGFIKNDNAFFELLDMNKDITREMCHKIGRVVAAYEKLNRFLATGPSFRDIEESVSEETLNSRINRTEKDFLYHVIRLAKENHIHMSYVPEKEVNALMNEVLTFIYTMHVTSAVYAA